LPGVIRKLLVVVVTLALGAAAWLLVPAYDVVDASYPMPGGGADDAKLVARGEYLAVAANCGTCHTAADGEYMAGGLAFETPFGTIYSTNITPDAETGIGGWTATDLLNSMRHGERPDGTHLYPVFPYPNFTKVSDEDVAALYAYLMSVPAVRNETPANALSFPFNLRILLAGWKRLFFRPGEFQPDATQPAAWNRGAYLVQSLAHCGACHSPRNRFGAEIEGLAMSGGEYLGPVPGGAHRPWFAPDLTSSLMGLGLWPAEELAAYLTTGRHSFIETFGPMNEVVLNSTRHLDSADIAAITGYLKSLPPSSPSERAEVARSTMGRGRTIYNLHCGTCHLPTGLGDPEMAPRLDRGSLVVQAENPASMINAILYSPALGDLPPRWRHPMDEFQYLLDDEEVAAVASYVRNAWNNRAGPVTAEQVARQR